MTAAKITVQIVAQLRERLNAHTRIFESSSDPNKFYLRTADGKAYSVSIRQCAKIFPVKEKE